MEEKWLEDEHGKYIWRTLNGAKVKIYKNYTVSESIVMANLQKSLDKEIEETKKRNADYVAEKLRKIGFEKASNIAGLDVKGKVTVNVDLINKGVDIMSDMSKKYPLKTVKLGTFKIDVTQYLGYVNYNYSHFEKQNMIMSWVKYARREEDFYRNAWAYRWCLTRCYDSEAGGPVDCPKPSEKMDCRKEDIPIYTFVHEYGHLLEHDIIIERMRRTDPDFGKEYTVKTSAASYAEIDNVRKKRNSQYMKIKNEILKIYKTDPELVGQYGTAYDWTHYVSNYGQTAPAEFFAELYAGSYLARDNDFGKNNRLIKAFKIWLKKERGYEL